MSFFKTCKISEASDSELHVKPNAAGRFLKWITFGMFVPSVTIMRDFVGGGVIDLTDCQLTVIGNVIASCGERCGTLRVTGNGCLRIIGDIIGQ